MPVSNRNLLIGIISISILIFVGLTWLIIQAPSEEAVNNRPEKNLSFNDTRDPSVGPSDVKVKVRMFSDFQCPACKIAELGVAYALDRYKDRVQFIWNDFPLETAHANARVAANAARCAEEQDKFWVYRDRLYTEQTAWSSSAKPQDAFISYASSSGVDIGQFQTCLESKRHDSKIADDIREGFANRVDRTPTFFINNRRYFTMNPTEWDSAIQQALTESP